MRERFVMVCALGLLAASASADISTSGSLTLQQGPAVLNMPEIRDGFGRAFAVGRFNDDVYADLAVGVPQEDFNDVRDAGIVHIFYGSPTGLASATAQTWFRGDFGAAGPSAAYDRLGEALAAGDFNGDGRDDLAIGVPGGAVDGERGAGMVIVVNGSPAGLVRTSARVWSQGTHDVLGQPERWDSFGSALSAADFDGDARDDLAVGVFGEVVSGLPNAGAVNVLYGSAAGLTASRSQLLDLNGLDRAAPHAGAVFGFSLASGDFNRDGRHDLAVGAPLFRPYTGFSGEGAVFVILGNTRGLDPDLLSPTLSRPFVNCFGVGNELNDAEDRFGEALAVGDFNRDGFDDLAVGVPGASGPGVHKTSGVVDVLYGRGGGFPLGGGDCWRQGRDGLMQLSERDDRFGSHLATGDVDADGYDDLVVGVPREDLPALTGGVDTIADAGIVQVIHGTREGLLGTVRQLWSQGRDGVPDAPQAGDQFGTVALGDFDGNGADDLVVGAVGEEQDGRPYDHGTVQVFYSNRR